jgi:hypothetical protein
MVIWVLNIQKARLYVIDLKFVTSRLARKNSKSKYQSIKIKVQSNK